MRWSRDGERVYTTIFDCAAFHKSLIARCGRSSCRREAIFEGAALWWLFHRKRWSDDLRDAEQQLRCAACRWRGGTLTPTDRPASVDTLPFPPKHEWQRVVSRYRC